MKKGILYNWLLKNKCLILGDDERRYTHLCMDGGKFRIENDQEEEFLQIYSQGLEKEERYFITEMPTLICRMFCDLDFLEKDYEWSKEKFSIVLKSIQEVIKEWYGKDYNCIVNMTDSKKVTKCGKNYIKTGIHLLWPELYITLKIALRLRNSMVEKLEEEYGERPEPNNWDDVVDECVFKTNGLRMIGSAKMVRKKNKETKRVQFIDEGRIYKPVLTHPDSKLLSKMLKDKNFMRQQTTIRMARGTMLSPFAKKEAELLIKETVLEEKKAARNKNKQLEKEDSGGNEIDGIKIKRNEPLFQKIQQYINNLSHWKGDKIALCRKMGDKDFFYYISIKGQGYCMNVGRAHNACGMYFLIKYKKQEKRAYMTQKCFCGCATEEGRKKGLCRKFESEGWPVPTLLRVKLFPKDEIGENNIVAPSRLCKNRHEQVLHDCTRFIAYYEKQIKKLEKDLGIQ